MSAMDENLIQEMAAEALDPKSVAADPITQFRRWYAQAKNAGIPREDAMTLATVGPDGAPAARVVLYKDLAPLGYAEPGFPFFTNYESDKAAQLAHDARAALVFHWKPPARQVRAEGSVEKTARRDFRRLFRHPPAQQPDRRMGLPPEPRGPLSRFYGEKRKSLRSRIRRPRRAASPPLGRLYLKTPLRGILAAPRQPPPRPRTLHAGR